MRYKEFSRGQKDLVIFDIDDTLLHTTAKIKVIDANGNPVRELTNQEFNNYTLRPGEQFDFGEFRNAEKFRQESKPIVPMVRKLKTILAHAGNAKVIMLTARADFDDKDTFLQTFKDLGIDMSRVHVHRAGNLPGDAIPAEKKAVWVRKYLNTKEYNHVRLYDDSMSNLRVFKELKKEYPDVDFRAIYVGPEGHTSVVENQDDYEIRNYEKLDNILFKLTNLVIAGQKKNPDKYGMVAAAVLDPDNNLVMGLNLPAGENKRRHAERVAIDLYTKKYGDIPNGSIIITTCSPCSEFMDERYGESCTDLINQSNVKKVYAGYMDPTQEEEHRDFNIMETENDSIRDMCKEFADTFLHLRPTHENFADGKVKEKKLDPDIYGEELPFHTAKSIIHNVITSVDPQAKLKISHSPEGYYSVEGEKIRMDFGITADAGEISANLVNAFSSYKGTGIVTEILRQCFKAMADLYGQPTDFVISAHQDRGHGVWQHIAQKLGAKWGGSIYENFADGRNPQDKGDSKRYKVPTKGSISSLRKIAKQGGRRGQLAHWMANMKSGRKK